MPLAKQIKRLTFLLFCVGILPLSPISAPAALAADDATTAMNLFRAKQYKTAVFSFRKAISEKPNDSTLYYYYALCLHYSNDINGARAAYSQIVRSFPGTDAAARSQSALAAFVAVAAPQQVSPSTITTDANAAPPVQINRDPNAVPFTKVGNQLIVPAEVNGRDCDMVFATGATNCCFNYEQARILGVPIPADTRIGRDGSASLPINSLRLGPIEKHNFEIKVADNPTLQTPIIGESFFGDWQFSIDMTQHLIHFLRR